MIPYSVYKVMHLTGVMMILLALGGVLMHSVNGGTKVNPFKKAVAITHGVGLLFALVGGFGLMARLGLAHGAFPGWIWAKLVIWLAMGGVLALIYRKPQFAKGLWVAMIALGATAAYLAGYKPF